MATVHICDRCGVQIAKPLYGVATSLVIPHTDPSTAPVTLDANVNLGVSGSDLCDLCLLSTLVEYAVARLAPSLGPQVIAAFSARINTALTPSAAAVAGAA